MLNTVLYSIFTIAEFEVFVGNKMLVDLLIDKTILCSIKTILLSCPPKCVTEPPFKKYLNLWFFKTICAVKMLDQL